MSCSFFRRFFSRTANQSSGVDVAGSVVPSNCPVVARSPAGVLSHGGVDGPVRPSSSGSVVPSNCPIVARSPAGVLSHGGVDDPVCIIIAYPL